MSGAGHHPDPSKLSLNTATVREQWNLREIIDACARHGIQRISPWRDKLDELGATETARLLRTHEITVSGLCRGGMFPAIDKAGREAAITDSRKAIADAAEIGADCLILVVGGLPAGSRDLPGARQMVIDGIAAIMDDARAAQVPLAIEPLHPMYCAERACVNTLDQALDICDALEGDTVENSARVLGIAADVYHFWWDPHYLAALERAGQKRLLAFHLCDWLVPTNDLLLDRGMMGDGVIDLVGIRQEIEALGYDGAHEVEILSSKWWAQDPDHVVKTVIERHRDCC